MRYKNADPMEKQQAKEIADLIIAQTGVKLQECIKRSYYNREWSILSRELKFDVYDSLIRFFIKKISEISFDDVQSTADDNATSEYDGFWNNEVIQDSASSRGKVGMQ